MAQVGNPPSDHPPENAPENQPSSDSHKPNTNNANNTFPSHKPSNVMDNCTELFSKFGDAASPTKTLPPKQKAMTEQRLLHSFPIHDRPSHLPYAASSHNSSKCNPSEKHSPAFSYQRQGGFMASNSTSYRSTEGVWNRNNQKQEGYGDASKAMTRGPREKREGNSSKTSPGDGCQGQKLKRDKYNLENFQCEYESAKFYVIKSFSEDDVHKSIKYKVWSSTPRGNEKLDHAFHAADANVTETGTKHPVFLFFSVNSSGQFLGVAEMIGQVDFNKNLDFWQADRWIGFFPVRWHIIKDVPSQLFYRVILENNEFLSVTRSRDTQEVELKQGVEMLQIFKSYSAKTSLLDDFSFYENRERSLKADRRRKSFSQNGGRGRMEKQCEKGEAEYMVSSPSSSLVKLTKNLAL